MMPVVKVWCLPKLEEEQLQKVHKKIVSAVTSVEALGLTDEHDMTVLFPTNMMAYGLGEEIIVEITGLFKRPKRTHDVIGSLAESVGSALKVLFPKSKIECFVYPFDPDVGGFWSDTPSQ